MQSVLKLFIVLFLLYPAPIGFIFNPRKPEIKRRVAYGLIAVSLALINMFVVIATYYGAFLSDSWLTFFAFFMFQISLFVTVIVHIIMVAKNDYNPKFAKIMAVVLLFFGILFSVSLILFSRPEVTSSEGVTITNSLLTILPAVLSSGFFVLSGTDRNVFVPKKEVAVDKVKNKPKRIK